MRRFIMKYVSGSNKLGWRQRVTRVRKSRAAALDNSLLEVENSTDIQGGYKEVCKEQQGMDDTLSLIHI